MTQNGATSALALIEGYTSDDDSFSALGLIEGYTSDDDSFSALGLVEGYTSDDETCTTDSALNEGYTSDDETCANSADISDMAMGLQQVSTVELGEVKVELDDAKVELGEVKVELDDAKVEQSDAESTQSESSPLNDMNASRAPDELLKVKDEPLGVVIKIDGTIMIPLTELLLRLDVENPVDYICAQLKPRLHLLGVPIFDASGLQEPKSKKIPRIQDIILYQEYVLKTEGMHLIDTEWYVDFPCFLMIISWVNTPINRVLYRTCARIFMKSRVGNINPQLSDSADPKISGLLNYLNEISHDIHRMSNS